MPRVVQKKRSVPAQSRRAGPTRRYAGGGGAYTLDTGPWAKRGAAAGAAIGGKFGGPIGSYLGSALGRRLFHYPATWFGSGAYTKRKRYAYGKGSYDVSSERLTPDVPVFSKNGDYVEISHKEYICDIISDATPGATRIEKFAINPAESATFPWLSSIVMPCFQQYRFEGLIFSFQTRSADALNSTNTALGSVVAGVDYDFTQQDFTNRSQVENLQWSQSIKPSVDALIPVECATRYTALGGGMLYVLNQGGTPTGVDLKTYMLGKLYILTTGMQGSSVNLGSLYVTYKIRLYKPMIQAPLSNANIVKIYRSNTAVAAPMGTTTVLTDYTCDTIGCTFSNTGITFATDRLLPGARYLIVWFYAGASTANLVSNIWNSTLVGMAQPGAFMSVAQTPDVSGTINFPPSANGSSEVSSMTLMEVVINDTVAQTGASINLPLTSTLPPGTLQFMMFERNGLNTANIGYFRGY